MYIPAVTPFSHSSMLLAESLGHVGGFGEPGMDQFVGMDPMEMRHGVFAWNGQPISGGGNVGGSSLKEIPMSAQSLTQTLFSGYRAPSDGNIIAQVAQYSSIGKHLKEGDILGWTQNVDGEKIPYMFALCEMPAAPEQIFDTLLDVNGLEAWMPRVMLFKSEDSDAKDPIAMRRRFRTHRSVHLEDIHSRFKTTVPHFYGRFCVDYRQLPGGALQMEWNLKGDQTPPAEDPKKLGLETPKDIRDLKTLKTNNSSFTLIPSPERPDRTVCAYHLNAQPVYMPFVVSVITMFLPQDNTNELDRLFQSLLNRTVSQRWTAKGPKDPLGLELTRVSQPTPHRFRLHKVY